VAQQPVAGGQATSGGVTGGEAASGRVTGGEAASGRVTGGAAASPRDRWQGDQWGRGRWRGGWWRRDRWLSSQWGRDRRRGGQWGRGRWHGGRGTDAAHGVSREQCRAPFHQSVRRYLWEYNIVFSQRSSSPNSLLRRSHVNGSLSPRHSAISSRWNNGSEVYETNVLNTAVTYGSCIS